MKVIWSYRHVVWCGRLHQIPLRAPSFFFYLFHGQIVRNDTTASARKASGMYTRRHHRPISSAPEEFDAMFCVVNNYTLLAECYAKPGCSQ